MCICMSTKDSNISLDRLILGVVIQLNYDKPAQLFTDICSCGAVVCASVEPVAVPPR